MKLDMSKIKEWLNTYVLSKIKPDKPLTEEEKRKRAKFIVYPAFILLFVGCIWLIYPLSDKKDRDGAGFNIEMPSPEKQDMQGNKVDAYEQAAMAAKEKHRKDTFEEMVSLFDKQKKEEPVRLPDVEDNTAKTNAGQSSVEAYRDMNRTLGNVYTSTNDPEKEALRRRVEELERQQHAGFLQASGVNPETGFLMHSQDAFTVTDACIGCGICTEVCPQGNYELTSRGVKTEGDCEFCFACIHNCPQKAILFKQMKEVNPNARYRNEHVSLWSIKEANRQ